jgi:hypothetical protein
MSLFTAIKRAALHYRKPIAFDITIEYLWRMFLRQKRCCALSGLQIHFSPKAKGDHTGYRSASLDRIDSSRGYVRGNVQWVHKDINLMKRTLPQERFIELCTNVARRND